MQKIKTFREPTPLSLDSAVNKFIEENQLDVIDVKYSLGYYDGHSVFTAMILYNEK